VIKVWSRVDYGSGFKSYATEYETKKQTEATTNERSEEWASEVGGPQS